MSKPIKGCIVILHNYLHHPPRAQVQSLLKDYYTDAYELQIEWVEIIPRLGRLINHQNLHNVEWRAEAAHQKRQIEKLFELELNMHVDYDIHYFGAAPVPLCIHLGLQVGSWRKVKVWLKLQTGNKEWYCKNNALNDQKVTLMLNGVPKEANDTRDDILIKVESSYRADDDAFKQSLGEQINLAKIIQIAYDPLMLDLPNVELAYEMGDAFKKVLNQVSSQLKKVQTIHLLALVPNSIAFLLGTHLNASVYYRIQTYQYSKRGAVYHEYPALLIGGNEREEIVLSEEELTIVQTIKAKHKEEWHRLDNLVDKNAEAKEEEKTWYEAILPKSTNTHYFEGHTWRYLPHLCDTYLKNAVFNAVAEPEGGREFGFPLGGRDWRLKNEMVYAMHKRFIKVEHAHCLQQALRLLLFHEIMHEKQGIMGHLSTGIGKFPKIVEIADYQADVWAMLHEYHYAKAHYGHKIGAKKDPSGFFVQLIDSAINTMWAFDDQGINLDRIKVRRLNRYLIWYWQRACIVHRNFESLQQILEVLIELPILEIKGLLPKTEEHNIFYPLHQVSINTANLELGVLWRHRVRRIGNMEIFNIAKLLKAFKERDHKSILYQISMLYNFLYDS